MTDPITVLIADDHGVVREGLRCLLERAGLRVVGEAATGQEAVALAATLQPDVVLLDIRMPAMDGLQALAAIKAEHSATSVILLTSHGSPGYLARALALGAAGFLSKDVDPARIPIAVRAAATGEHLVDPTLLRAALATAATEAPLPATPGTHADDLLSEAETRVLRLLAEGLDNDTIANALTLSVNTVKTHVKHIFAKLKVSDRTQAALWALRHGVE